MSDTAVVTEVATLCMLHDMPRAAAAPRFLSTDDHSTQVGTANGRPHASYLTCHAICACGVHRMCAAVCRYGAGAPAAMTITHYPELVDSKGVVLARGDIVNDKMLNPGEARAVMQLLRAFYTDADDYKMVGTLLTDYSSHCGGHVLICITATNSSIPTSASFVFCMCRVGSVFLYSARASDKLVAGLSLAVCSMLRMLCAVPPGYGVQPPPRIV